MSQGSAEEQDGDLPPPGTRWGSGAQSVLPYLTKSLQAKPAAAMDARDATRPGDARPVPACRPQRPAA